MKNFLLLFFLSFSCFSQTIVERERIKSYYDFGKIAELYSKADSFYSAQRQLIKQYKENNFFVESENNSLQFIDNGIPLFFSVNNQGSAISLGINRLYPGGGLGLNLTGAGMLAGVWDGGLVRESHQELSGGKVIYGGDVNSNLSDHSTHVTGTIIARGVSPIRRGMAYNANAITYSFTDDYLEMLTFGSEGYLVSNHSYGLIATGITSARFGAYDFLAVQMDELANAFPYYQIVIAAGNDRNSFSLPQVVNKGGYDLISGRGVSKNSIVVAAVEDVPIYSDNFSVTMSAFSNFGPTDDGRIKPDISSKGVGVSSCTSFTDTSYATLQGTSMATPAITGMILLLQQHYNNLNPSNFMRAATVRGLICHSAKECGMNPGPDYEFGWGLGNAEEAVKIISGRGTTAILSEETLNNGEVFTKQISITATQNIAATICWTDPTGVPNASNDVDNRTARLVNNLDLKILKDGVTYYPWKLDFNDPLAQATNNSDNNVDNVEKVEIFNAPPGVYTIEVKHKGTLQGGVQNFSLIANGNNALSLNLTDFNNSDKIFVYPNPVKDILNFSIENEAEVSSITICDVAGKEVYSIDRISDISSLDISSLINGVYFITFQTEQSIVTKKFVKL